MSSNVTGMRLVAGKDGSYDIVPVKRPDKQVVSPSGSPIRPIYHRKFNDRHSAVYVHGKDVNMYERIQSYSKQCDIVSLMARAKTDPSVLQQRNGFYGDFSASGDIQDMVGAYNNMKGAFENLGAEEKNQLGGSFESFLSGIANGTLGHAIDAQRVTEQPNEESEVKPDEQK